MQAANETAVRFEVRYEDGSLSGWLPDREVVLGHRRVKLSQLRRLTYRPKPEVELSEGTKVEGTPEEHKEIELQLGEKRHRLDLSRAIETIFVAPYQDPRKPCLDALLLGVFVDPPPSDSPVNSALLVSFPDRVFSGAASPAEQDFALTGVEPTNSGVKLTFKQSFRVHERLSGGGWNVELAVPFGEEFGVGDYESPPAVAAFVNLIDLGGLFRLDTPGRFVVWELERNGDKITRLAVDFRLHVSCKDRNETWCGKIRFNSLYR
jgi:hypothetical protein